jgi:opacity protein-like surface antigen
MSRLWVFIAFVVIATAAAAAQPIPQFDLFGGYSFGHISTGDFPRHANLNGWDASATYNWNKWFGIMVEGSGLYGSKEIAPATTIIFLCGQPSCPSPISLPARAVSNMVHTYSLGPRFSFRNHTRYTPFARALFGGGYISATPGGLPSANGASVLTAGGGVDIALTSRLALRTQTDFLRNRFFHQTGPDFRLATGLVFHLGRK